MTRRCVCTLDLLFNTQFLRVHLYFSHSSQCWYSYHNSMNDFGLLTHAPQTTNSDSPPTARQISSTNSGSSHPFSHNSFPKPISILALYSPLHFLNILSPHHLPTPAATSPHSLSHSSPPSHYSHTTYRSPLMHCCSETLNARCSPRITLRTRWSSQMNSTSSSLILRLPVPSVRLTPRWLLIIAAGSSLFTIFPLLSLHIKFTPFPSANSSGNCFLPSAPSWP